MGSLALSCLYLAVFSIVLCRRQITCFLVLTLELLELRKLAGNYKSLTPLFPTRRVKILPFERDKAIFWTAINPNGHGLLGLQKRFL